MIKVITVNIEADKHLDRVIPFLKKENADVICLQEVLEKDVEYIKDELGMLGEYVPCMEINKENMGGFPVGNIWGVLILTAFPEFTISEKYYYHAPEVLPLFNEGNPNASHRVLLVLETKKNNELYRVITTHFTWTPDGKSSDLQYTHLHTMLAKLSEYEEFVLCGDFNAPRGEDIWEELATRFTDTIPPNITTTLDNSYHRTPGLELVVDGMFTTPGYSASSVRVIDGVSDHQAVSAVITKNS